MDENTVFLLQKRRFSPFPMASSTLSEVIYGGKVTEERLVDVGGKMVRDGRNDSKQTLFQCKTDSTLFQIRLYFQTKETLLSNQTDFTCPKRTIRMRKTPQILTYDFFRAFWKTQKSCELF